MPMISLTIRSILTNLQWLTNMKKILLLIFVLFSVGAQAQSPSFGRLFTTEDERAMLNEMRQLGEAHVAVSGSTNPIMRGDTVVFNGVYSSKNGEPVYWFNEGRSRANEVLVIGADSSGGVLISDDKDRQVEGLKPGQAYEFKAKVVREYFYRPDALDNAAQSAKLSSAISEGNGIEKENRADSSVDVLGVIASELAGDS